MSLINLLMKARIFGEGVFSERKLSRNSMDPQGCQLKVLKKILSKHANTEFGKKYKFDEIATAEEFRAQVPIHEYEDLRPWIEEQDRTGRSVITSTLPLMYATTSGTTGKPKYIPILKESLEAQKAIQNLSTYRLLKDHPKAFNGKLLGIVSPAVEGFMPSGIPFGSCSGHIYQGMPSLARKKYVVPYEVFGIEDYDLKYLLIIRLAMGQRDLSYIATANPSTLVRLANMMEEHWEALVEDIRNGGFCRAQELTAQQRESIASRMVENRTRADELTQLKSIKGGSVGLLEIWPNLQVIGCWTGGSCGIFLQQLRRKLDPKIAIRDIGYLSSEFRGTFTLGKNTNAGVPSFQYNFLEFVERDTWDRGEQAFVGLESLEHGKQYYIFVTTDSGLYRYHMHDVVEVDGFYNQVPKLRFIQKGKGVTNITGEKLYESQIIESVCRAETALDLTSNFFMAVANEEASVYRLYYELAQNLPDDSGGLKQKLAVRIEQILTEINLEYSVKRKSGRLHPVIVTFLKKGTYDAFKCHMVDRGQREGQFKIVALQYQRDLTFDFAAYSNEEAIRVPWSQIAYKVESAVL